MSQSLLVKTNKTTIKIFKQGLLIRPTTNRQFTRVANLPITTLLLQGWLQLLRSLLVIQHLLQPLLRVDTQLEPCDINKVLVHPDDFFMEVIHSFVQYFEGLPLEVPGFVDPHKDLMNGLPCLVPPIYKHPHHPLDCFANLLRIHLLLIN